MAAICSICRETFGQEPVVTQTEGSVHRGPRRHGRRRARGHTSLHNSSQSVCALKCGHVFHKACLDSWLLSKHNSTQVAVTACPNCNKTVSTNEITKLYFQYCEEETNPSQLPEDNSIPERNRDDLSSRVHNFNLEELKLSYACLASKFDNLTKDLETMEESMIRVKQQRDEAVTGLADLGSKIENVEISSIQSNTPLNFESSSTDEDAEELTITPHVRAARTNQFLRIGRSPDCPIQ